MKRKDILRTLEHLAPPPRPIIVNNHIGRITLTKTWIDEVLDELWNTPQERIIVTGIDERGLPIVRRGTDHDTTQ